MVVTYSHGPENFYLRRPHQWPPFYFLRDLVFGEPSALPGFDPEDYSYTGAGSEVGHTLTLSSSHNYLNDYGVQSLTYL